MSTPTSDEIIDDLSDASDDTECLYLDRPQDAAYIWPDPDGDEYLLLEQSRAGVWLPYPRPIDGDRAAGVLKAALDDDTATYEIRPQTELPPGRHSLDDQ